MSNQPLLPTIPRTPVGEIRIWLTGLGVSAGLIMIFGFLAIIFCNGLDAFWPKTIHTFQIDPKGQPGAVETVYASIAREQQKRDNGHPGTSTPVDEYQLFTGSRDVYGQAFRYVDKHAVVSRTTEPGLMEIEKLKGGRSLVKPLFLQEGDRNIPAGTPEFGGELSTLVGKTSDIHHRIDHIRKNDIAGVNEHLDQANRDLKALNMSYDFHDDKGSITTTERKSPVVRAKNPVDERNRLLGEIKHLQEQYERHAERIDELLKTQTPSHLHYQLGDGVERSIPIDEIVSYTEPNNLGFFGKLGVFFKRIGRFIWEDPREANTEGGIFPAIFGTFVMTVLMSALVTPIGVIAAIYLHEYARQGPLVRLVRICVNNLAGVPSIVFGVFGLGFFVYFVGGGIDELFFSKKLAVSQAPTFGTSGVLWASLTLALMTLPVVIVATEEALSAVPRGLREAALACGASKWQMIQRIILPGALPGVLTGIILAMARGAGEVAPLMITGVVKLAPSLPIDLQAPFIHLERKFMHLGFHIYDVGFQSPDSDAARSMVFATTLLLILLVIAMNLAAIIIRNKLRNKHQLSSF